MDIGAELIGLYIEHDGEWDLISDGLGAFFLNEAGEFASGFVADQLPESWGVFGDRLGEVTSLAISSEGNPDVFGPAIATLAGDLAGLGVGSVLGDEESIIAAITAQVTEIVALSELQDNPGAFIDQQLTLYIFGVAGEELSSLARGGLTAANGGQSNALIESTVDLIDLAVSNGWRDSDELEAILINYASGEFQDFITSQFPECAPGWAVGLGDQVVGEVFDGITSGNTGAIGSNVTHLLVNAAATGQIDGSDLGTCFEQANEEEPDVGHSEGAGTACQATESSPAFSNTGIPSFRSAPNTDAQPLEFFSKTTNKSSESFSKPGARSVRFFSGTAAPSASCPLGTDFTSWLVGLHPSAEVIENLIDVAIQPDGQQVVTAKSGFEDRRLVIDGNTGRLQRRDLTPAGNWVTDSGSVVRVVRDNSDQIVNFVEPITGDFRTWVVGLPIIEATQLFTYSSRFEDGVSSEIATPLFDSRHRLRILNDVAIIETSSGPGQWDMEVGALFVLRSGGEIVGFQTPENGDVASLFDNLLELLVSSASIVVQTYVGALNGCNASIQEHADDLKEAFLELWNAESILSYLADQWAKIQTIKEAFETDPLAFTEQFLSEIVRAEEFNSAPRGEWAGLIVCDIAIAIVLAGAGGAAFSSAGRLFSRIDEIRAFRNNRDNNSDSSPNSSLCNSFPTGTQVRMADGSLQPIEHVEPGDFVLAADPVTGEWSSQLVLDQWSHLDDGHLATAFLDDGSQITATDHHRFWVESSGAWVDLDDVAAGDYLLTPNGVTPVAATIIHPVADTLVWELDTAGPDTFTVNTGTSDVLVHNQDSDCFLNLSTALQQLVLSKADELGVTPDALAILSQDGAFGNQISVKSIREAEVGIQLRLAKRIVGPLRPDPSGAGEFFDGNLELWDVKAFNSIDFDVAREISKIQREFNLGEHVLLDIKNLNDADLLELIDAVAEHTFTNPRRIEWSLD